MSAAVGLTSPSFCVLPWVHMATYTNGALLLCCVAKDRLGLDLNHTSLEEAWNSPQMREVRRDLIAGKKIPHCEICYAEERTGARSHRQAEGSAWQERLGEGFFSQRIAATRPDGHLAAGMVALDLRLGNTCNLQCVMCRPQDSSRWIKFGEQLAREAEDPELRKDWLARGRIDATRFAWFNKPGFVDSFKLLAPDLRELIIGGGEPMLLPEHERLLDACLQDNHASHIRLRYHSNGTVLDTRIFEKWKHFQQVEFFVSIDGVGAKNEYLRHPCAWPQLTLNLQRLDDYPFGNLRVVILASLHLLNFFYINELAQWIQEQNFKLISKGFTGHFLTGIVHHPEYLSIQNYPQDMKNWIADQVLSFEKSSRKPSRKIQGVLGFMNQRDGSRLLPAVREYVRRLDAQRGTRFDQTFPELNRFFEVYGSP